MRPCALGLWRSADPARRELAGPQNYSLCRLRGSRSGEPRSGRASPHVPRPVRLARPAAPPRPVLLSTRRWWQKVAALLADSFPFGGLRCCPPTIRLLPYQLEPALAIFRHGATRLLVADDVGVGKTVEAGLIIREVAGRAARRAVLILVPASLKDQWRQELHTLFSIDPIDAGADWLLRSSGVLPAERESLVVAGHLPRLDGFRETGRSPPPAGGGSLGSARR